MIVAGLGIGWLKVITTIINLVASVGCLGLLYITGEFKRRRSLWLVTGFAGILLCVLVSLLLGFPAPPVA